MIRYNVWNGPIRYRHCGTNGTSVDIGHEPDAVARCEIVVAHPANPLNGFVYHHLGTAEGCAFFSVACKHGFFPFRVKKAACLIRDKRPVMNTVYLVRLQSHTIDF